MSHQNQSKMATKMFSPKIEIINYFDELINQVDIEVEEALRNFKENQVLGDLRCFIMNEKTTIHFFNKFGSSENDSDQYQTPNLWTKSTKVVDYLNQVRIKSIQELRKAQEEALDYYKLNSTRFNDFREIKRYQKEEELKSQLFSEMFCFQVRYDNNDCKFDIFTFVTDFYMSPADITILK